MIYVHIIIYYNNIIYMTEIYKNNVRQQLDMLFDLFKQNKEATEYSSIWADLSVLTCGFCMKKSAEELIQELSKSAEIGDDIICTDLGRKISDVLIKDVVMHIFNIKEHFIVE